MAKIIIFKLIFLFPFAMIWMRELEIARADKVVIHAHIGENVTLNYSSGDTRISDIVGILFTRTDLKRPNYVLLYRDGRLDTDHQDPRYKDRVVFVHPDLKDDLSVIIRNVSVNDSGTYEMKLNEGEGSNRSIFDVPAKITFNLNVTKPEIPDNGPAGVPPAVPPAVPLAVLVVIVAFLAIYFLCKQQNAAPERVIETEMITIVEDQDEFNGLRSQPSEMS